MIKKLLAFALLAAAGLAIGQQNDPIGGGANINITSGYIAPSLSQVPYSLRNLLDNGAFNIYQRGTTAVTAINTTATYHADRWAGYSNNAGASVSLTNITSSLPFGFANAEQVQRANSNANLTPVFLVQEIPTSEVTALQGQPVCVSAYLIAGANFSAASSKITVQVITGTGTDQGLSSLLSASWTGQATTLNDSSQTVTASWQRFTPNAWCFVMPTTATEAAVQFGFTPVGTAGANDWFQVTGAQFEQVTTPPAGITGARPSVFEQRPLGIETLKVQRYFWQLTEANTFLPFAAQCTATNVITASMPLPVQMRTAPTGGVTAGGFQVVIAGAAATGVTTLAAATNTVNTLTVTTANTCTAGNAVSVRGSGTTGKITATADF